jgi:hypothetical protein
VNVQSAQLIAYACVEVIGKIGRSRAEFVVHFSHRGAIRDGYQFLPTERHLVAQELPAEVKTAAMTTYEGRYERPV